jgi:hypothetical protein
MVKKCAIPLLWIMIGTNAYGQDCFYEQKTQFTDGSAVNQITRYDCQSPPETIVVEKIVESEQRTLGEFLFGTEEKHQGVSNIFSTLVSIGVF